MKRSKLLLGLGALAFGGVFALTSCGADEKETKVNEAIDKYVSKYLIDDIKDDTVAEISTEYSNFTNFWTYLVVGLLKDNKYEIDIKNQNSAIYNYIKNYDVSTLSGTDFGKYYYYAKAFDINLDSYKAKYLEFIDKSLESEYTVGYSQEYSIPFEIAPAKHFNVQCDKLDNLVNTTYVPDLTVTYGTDTYTNYDGYNWFQTVNLLFGKEKNTTTLSTIAGLDYSNETPTTIALSIATFAASNENVRKNEYKQNNKDLVELLLESYDPNLGLIKVFATDTGINYSTNQIYASLIAYKYQRVNIFR